MALRQRLWFGVLLGLTAGSVLPAMAAGLQVGLATDAGTLDPHALNAGPTMLVTRQIYEPLIARDRNMEKVPGLAESWQLEEPTRWRIRLRPGVRFHDGAPFDADDVIFSINRALAPTSDLKVQVDGIRDIRRIDDRTVDLVTEGPDPILPDKLTRVLIMDAGWSRQHGVSVPQDFRAREETYAVRQANGTGPYRLLRREPDSRTEFVRFDGWWATASGGNVERLTFNTIANDATRLSALLSGEIDFVLDVPPQSLPALQRDRRVRVLTGPENRTVFLGMNQKMEKLPASAGADSNPFKDVRVRRAVYHAIDIDSLHRQTMRGQSLPTGSMWAPSIKGYAAEDDVRLPFDRAAARGLLSEAGLGAGFTVTLDCPNNRYVNDEHICTALAAMLAHVGIDVRVNLQSFGAMMTRVQRRESAFYLLAWAPATFDALVTLQAIMRSPGQGADGSGNFSGYSNPAVDRLIDAVKTEVDPGRRLATIRQAHRLHNQDVGHIPLHHQVIAWAMRAGIDAVIQPENQVDIKWVTVGPR